jgi:hypothetical protein
MATEWPRAESIVSFRRFAPEILDDKAGGDLERCRLGFSPREINELKNLHTFPWVLASNGQIHLEVGGIPEFSRGQQRLGVSHRASANGKRRTRADNVKIIDNAGPQALAGKVAGALIE